MAPGPTRQPVAGPRLGRGSALVLSGIASCAAYVALPIAIARDGPRVGWLGGRPGPANRLGLLLVGLGAAGLGWCFVVHYPPGETVAVSLTPERLLASGPYQHSRNPMYVSEQAMLLGWALFCGSPVLLGYNAAIAAVMRQFVRREEQTLEARFGQSWREYIPSN